LANQLTIQRDRGIIAAAGTWPRRATVFPFLTHCTGRKTAQDFRPAQ
jgi:hypothetical protein